MPVFHNSGHLTRGKRDILRFFSHLELESLPTGGWGYDDFPWLERMLRGEDRVDDRMRREWLALRPSAVRRAARVLGSDSPG